tara:strand:- start:266 stop:493 length:228 start_codon:yes stop_codon:yes gene_type:complete
MFIAELKEEISKEVEEVSDNLDKIYSYLDNEADFRELEKKILNKFIKEKEKNIRFLTEECIRAFFGQAVLDNLNK